MSDVVLEFCQRNRLPYIESSVVEAVFNHCGRADGQKLIEGAVKYLQWLLAAEYGLETFLVSGGDAEVVRKHYNEFVDMLQKAPEKQKPEAIVNGSAPKKRMAATEKAGVCSPTAQMVQKYVDKLKPKTPFSALDVVKANKGPGKNRLYPHIVTRALNQFVKEGTLELFLAGNGKGFPALYRGV